jgi:FHA domain
MEWNDIARQLVVPLAPVQQTRAMAIVHVAMHDAVNAITGEYERYNPIGSAPAGASPQAAAIAAANRALAGIFGDSAVDSAFPGKYTASLAAHGISSGDPGLAFGALVAQGILDLRQNDGAAVAAYPYVPPDAGDVGVWMPINSSLAAQALLPGWGNVTPWALTSGSQFRPEPPPVLGSEAYAKDYNEILHIGALMNSARTDEQTRIALFWRGSPTALWNPILRKAVDAHHVAEIRRATGDTAHQSEFVRTVHRFGYRFVSDVAERATTRGDSRNDARMYLTTADRQFLLPEGKVEIGRSSDAGIRIDAAGVSRRHARIVISGDEARV